ncbi:GTPase/DUF3482 domain-containing protein [Castellaniella sp.]|uniref:GTPase/DUF3482 domain-containing protein n=1 Tax=Castellaniella sp. TaxID=1955812 RepID=UPI003569C7B1
MAEHAKAVDLAVVGHTNTGKTSLLRTLLRDEHFGAVADQPGTTRQVESARLLDAHGRALLILRDTPGLEDAMGTLDHLDTLPASGSRPDGPERIRTLLDSPAAQNRFEQECRVLKAVLQADAALYVIDARDPVLPKHRDELALLAMCGRPILPVLNFTHAAQADPAAWRTALARQGLHVSVDFDTVVPPVDGEMRLLQRLALLLERHAPALQRLQDHLQAERVERRRDAVRLIAELLVDAAALRLSCVDEPTAVAATARALRARIRAREQRCVEAMLKRYRFSAAVFPQHTLPLEGERWGMDLFHPQALRQFGIHVGKGMATGAVAGATVDVLTGGLSLGAATLLGAALGGTWQGAGQWGRRLMSRLSGRREMTLDDPVLQLLGIRQLALLRALEQRGHAASQTIAPDTVSATGAAAGPATPDGRADSVPPAQALPPPVQDLLKEARSQPAWCAIEGPAEPDERRDAVIAALADALQATLQAAA